MKTKILYFSMILCFAAISCTRNGDIQPKSVNGNVKNIHPLKDGNDDDVRILMEKVIKHEGTAISGANIQIVNGADTLIGTSDSSGSHQFTLPRGGLWDLTITDPLYIDYHATLNLTDSFTTRTDTLTAR